MAAAPSPNLRPIPARPPTVPTFDQELCGLVLDTAPRLFAVVQVCDEGLADADGWVAAWGFADATGSTHVTGVDGRTRLTLPPPSGPFATSPAGPGSPPGWSGSPRRPPP
ncbi:hypothetical protein [Kitasatospora sp. NPDC054795]